MTDGEDDDALFTEQGANFERKVKKNVRVYGRGYGVDRMELVSRLRAIADALEAGGIEEVSEEWDPHRHAGGQHANYDNKGIE